MDSLTRSILLPFFGIHASNKKPYSAKIKTISKKDGIAVLDNGVQVLVGKEYKVGDTVVIVHSNLNPKVV